MEGGEGDQLGGTPRTFSLSLPLTQQSRKSAVCGLKLKLKKSQNNIQAKLKKKNKKNKKNKPKKTKKQKKQANKSQTKVKLTSLFCNLTVALFALSFYVFKLLLQHSRLFSLHLCL